MEITKNIHHPNTQTLNLTCPKCGTIYSNYSEYFACWTKHLTSIPANAKAGTFKTVISEREEALNYYLQNPDLIEEGLKIVKTKVNIFNGGVIDLYAVDKDGKIVLIDFSGKYWKIKYRQFIKIRNNLATVLPQLLGLDKIPDIRIIMIKHHKYKKEG